VDAFIPRPYQQRAKKPQQTTVELMGRTANQEELVAFYS
jgi:hypothetical protein